MRKILIGFFLIGLAGCGFLSSSSYIESSSCLGESTSTFYGRLKVNLKLSCPYEEECGELVFDFNAIDEAPSHIEGCCHVGKYVYTLRHNQILKIVTSADYDRYTFPKSKSESVQFVLEDDKGNEREYSVNFSELIHSYKKRGDSVNIAVPSNCFLEFYTHADDTLKVMRWIASSKLENGMFGFSALDDYYPYYTLICSWNGEDPEKDDVVNATVYVGWRHPTEEEQ
jgi:hypothetical protein